MRTQGDEHVSDITPEVLEKYTLKAIPTNYNGIAYRSRLEARWAVFFDTLRIQHEYEREGLELGDGISYLPDFWLPQQKFWVEIKGADPDEDACEKAHRLAVASGSKVFVFFGGITLPDAFFFTVSKGNGRYDSEKIGVIGPGFSRGHAFFPDGSADHDYRWCQCVVCDHFGITFQGRSDRLPCKECYQCAWYRKQLDNGVPDIMWPTVFENSLRHSEECNRVGGCKLLGHNLDTCFSYGTKQLVAAYQTARAMRFTR